MTSSQNRTSVLKVENLWKYYGLPLFKIKEKFQRNSVKDPIASNRTKSKKYALKEISFSLNAGESLGILGHNGAGKSTLLKILAGVTPATYGEIEITKYVFPMIELNAGLNTDLTGIENIFLLGAIMGMTKKEIKSRLSSIIKFADIGEWINEPVRKYSSGMLARLGFSVAVNINSKLILIDEVLAVGDLAFQKKCFSHLEKLKREGVAIIIVSHSVRQLERFCDRIMLLKNGEIIELGTPQEVCYRYINELTSNQLNEQHTSLKEKRKTYRFESSGELTINDFVILSETKKRQETFNVLDPIIIKTSFNAISSIEEPVIGLNIYSADMLLIAAFSNDDITLNYVMKDEGSFECSIPSIPLLPGIYSIGLTIKSRDNRVIFRGLHMAQLNIQYSDNIRQSRGLIHIEPDWHF